MCKRNKTLELKLKKYYAASNGGRSKKMEATLLRRELLPYAPQKIKNTIKYIIEKEKIDILFECWCNLIYLNGGKI